MDTVQSVSDVEAAEPPPRPSLPERLARSLLIAAKREAEELATKPKEKDVSPPPINYVIADGTEAPIGTFLGCFHGAALPAGALVLTTQGAPTDARAILSGFTSTNGTAVGGTWNYSAAVNPQPGAFAIAAKAALGGVGAIQASSVLFQAVALCFDALNTEQWADMVTIITVALSASTITQTQYNALKAAAAEYDIPITLP